MSGRDGAPLVAFRRLADAPPPERELISVMGDGTATGWRSNGRLIGRFAGRVRDLEALRLAVRALDSVPPPPMPDVPPDAAVETVELAGRAARFESRAPVEGAWGPLVRACRSLLDELTGSPSAAIGGVLTADGRMRLEARGDGVLPVELASLEVSVVLWRDGREAASGRMAGEGLGRVEAGPGWAIELAAPGVDLAGGGTLVGVARFVADDGGIFVPVALTATAEVAA